MRKIKLLYLLPIAAMVFAGCELKNKNTEPEQQEQGGEQGGEQQQQQPVDFVGLALNDSTVTFDGQPHSISVSGQLPEGAQVSYGDAGNSFTAVGDHEVTATITCAGYNTLVLNGTLHIVAAEFAGISFAGDTVTYDGQAHSISLTGELPTGATVVYMCGQTEGNSFTNAGAYEITATVHCEGYTDATFTATLTINKANFEGIVFEDAQVAYDGQPHSIAPQVPAAYQGAVVTYDENGNEFTGSGLHVVTATVSLANYNDWSRSAKLVIGAGPVASANLSILDCEGLSDNDLSDEFDLKFYNNGWVTPQSFKVGIEKNQVLGTGNQTMKMTMTHQGSAFKATKELGNLRTYNKYNGFAIDTMMDSHATGGTMKLQVQFWLKDLPLPDAYAGYRYTYATYTLSNNAPSIWTHWEIPFDDPSLSICSGSIPVSALAGFGMTAQDLTSYISEVAILITPNYVNGQNCYAYVDNIALTTNTNKVVQKHIYGGRYGAQANGTYFDMNLSEDLTTAEFFVDGISDADLKVEKAGTTVTFKDADHDGAGLTVVADITDTGTLAISSITGAAQAEYAMLQDLEFTKLARLNYDLENKSSQVGNPLNDSNWKQEKWDTNWLNISNCMNVRSSGGNVFANMVTGYYMDYRYTYQNPVELGLANRFSVDIANDYSGCADIKLKVKLIEANGTEHFVVGTSSNYETVPASTAKWYNVDVNLDNPINVKTVIFTVKSTRGDTDYFYFDNLKVEYHVDYPVHPENLTYNSKYYLWNGSNDAFRLDFSESQEYAKMYKLGVAGETYFDVTIDGANVTLKDHDNNGAGLTIAGTLDGDLNITVSSVTGAAAAIYSASLNTKVFKTCEDVSCDFSDGTQDATYTNSHWTESIYGNSGWSAYAAPSNMRSKSLNGNKIVNMHCGTAADNFLYTPDTKLGPVNHLTVDLGNYWGSASGALRYKISILDNSGNVARYIAGDGSNWATLDKDSTSQLHSLEFNFTLTVGYKLRITTSMASGEAYLYMDNLKLNYKAPVRYTLNDTSTFDISEDNAQFFGWVWQQSGAGMWLSLTLKTDTATNKFYFEVDLPDYIVGMKILRVDPDAGDKPTAGSTTYGTPSSWNETGDILLSGAGGAVDVAFNAAP